MKPDRALFLSPDDVEKAVDEALNDVARQERVDVKSIRPDILLESRYVQMLAGKLKLPYRLKIISFAKGDTRKGEWMFKQRVDELADNLRGMAANVRDLRAFIEENKPTTELIDFILDNMQSKVSSWDSTARKVVTETTSLRQQITNDVAVYSDDDGDEDEDDTKDSIPPEVGEEGLMPTKEKAPSAKGLGAVQFLYALVKPNEHDQSNATNPEESQGFVQKVARYSKIAESLRIDPDKWEKEQQKIDPEQRKEKPPAISLSTVHSVKGAQWKNVTVLMPRGLFPMERKPKPDEPPPDPIVEKARMKAERNLAYVALTRAAVNLEVTCPMNKGVSPFVFQAGLTPGENVPKPGADQQEVIREASTEVWIPAHIEEY
jgi:superfamily I DNA/RNA helicase